MFRELRDIQLTAVERDLTVETIEGHIAKGIRQGLMEIDEILPGEEVEEISGYFPEDLSNIKLRTIKDNAPAEVTFGQLKIVLAFLQKQAEES